jgi:hypothetical protein
MSLLGALGPFVARDGSRRTGRGCELCGALLDPDHPHLADVERHALACACRSCALLFTTTRSGVGSRWRTVPDRHLRDRSFSLTGEEWEALGIPVSMAFFFTSASAAPPSRWSAVYPSPGGPVESLLRLDAWEPIASRTNLATAIEPEVEALLLAASDDEELTYECMLVPIHACYALVGQVRRRWRGLDGGEEARRAIAEHLATLRARCGELTGERA